MNDNLPRVLSFRDLVLLTLGSVIGSGIFIVPASVLRMTGGSFNAALVVWIIGGVLSVLGALTYGELGAMKPEAGGLYVYIRDAFGELVAFLYGWALFLVISSATIATLAVAFAGYLGQFVELSAFAEKAVAVVMIAIITVINVLSTRQSANVQNVSTAIKVAAILIMSGLLMVLGHGLAEPAPAQLLSSGGLLTGMGAAMIGVLWAYEAWQYVTFSAGEVVDPQRNFARGIVIGTAALVLLYLLANIGYVSALGIEHAQQSPRIASEAVTAILGPLAGKLIAAAILVSIFSAAHATVMTAPRVYFAMARDRLFFRRLADVHPRFGTPAVAVIASSAWAAVMASTGTFDQLLTYVVFTGWVFYSLAAAAIFHYRRSNPDAPRPFRTPGYPLTPILFIVSGAAIVVNTLITQPGRAFVGICIVLLGIPAFWFWQRRRA